MGNNDAQIIQPIHYIEHWIRLVNGALPSNETIRKLPNSQNDDKERDTPFSSKSHLFYVRTKLKMNSIYDLLGLPIFLLECVRFIG